MIALRRLDPDADLHLVHGWMQQPHVAPWWGLEGPPARVRDYLRGQAELAHLDCWIASEEEHAFAYVETYVAAEDPLSAHYDALPGDRGIHLLVGPPELLGRGPARRLVRHVVACLLAQPGATRVVCEPDARNARMLAFCEAVGGARLATLADVGGREVELIAWT